tara:strand:+ start:4222 stop:4896 length:675 start_codon:yes stop_codon:yes gene_type:complete
MPSIIEVDTIKNKTGTQNTVLSTDGSGNNTLNANTIKDGSATKTLATLSSSAVTLHNDVTFPTGHIVNFRVIEEAGSSHTTTSDSYEAVITYKQISCTSGNSIVFFWNGYVGAERVPSNSTRHRFGYLRTQYHTSSVSAGDTSSLGSNGPAYIIGNELVSATDTQAGQYNAFHLGGQFVATQATHYLGLAFNSGHNGSVSFTVNWDTSHKLVLYYYEIQGDVIT